VSTSARNVELWKSSKRMKKRPSRYGHWTHETETDWSLGAPL